MITLNGRLFLAINASAHPNALTVTIASLAATWLVYAAAGLVSALWIWGCRNRRGALLAIVLGVSAGLGINQMLGLLWYEPRPLMIGLGHALVFHAVENSFPIDHATFVWSLGFAVIAKGAAKRWGALVYLAGLLVAWARVYLGLHSPIDMAVSLSVATVSGGMARAASPASERWLRPVTHELYEAALCAIHLPPTLFPRNQER